MSLEDLQQSTARVGESVHKTNIRWAFMEAWQEENHKKSCLPFAIGHVEDTAKHVEESALVR